MVEVSLVDAEYDLVIVGGTLFSLVHVQQLTECAHAFQEGQRLLSSLDVSLQQMLVSKSSFWNLAQESRMTRHIYSSLDSYLITFRPPARSASTLASLPKRLAGDQRLLSLANVWAVAPA